MCLYATNEHHIFRSTSNSHRDIKSHAFSKSHRYSRLEVGIFELLFQSIHYLGNVFQQCPKICRFGWELNLTVDNFPLSLFYFWSEYPTPNSLFRVGNCNHTAATAFPLKSEKFWNISKINSIHFAPKFQLLPFYLGSNFSLWYPGKN